MGGRSLNMQAAAIFRDCAGILRQQKANPFRINAYLRAAAMLESLEFDDWLELGEADSDQAGIASRIRSIDVTVGNLHILGQHLVDQQGHALGHARRPAARAKTPTFA